LPNTGFGKKPGVSEILLPGERGLRTEYNGVEKASLFQSPSGQGSAPWQTLDVAIPGALAGMREV